MSKKIYMASDGSGFDLKNSVKLFLEGKYEIVDFSVEPGDYYDGGDKVGKAVESDKGSFGIVCCGNGFGIANAANIHQVVATNCISVSQARSARAINNANILSMGGEFVTGKVGCEIAEAFLDTDFGHGLTQEVKEYLENSFDKIADLAKR